jgi:MFS family permease
MTYLLQAFGIFLSINASTAFTAGLAAVIFGGTFMGITALAMAEGTRRAGKEGRRAAAVMTACFGAGQVVGPPLAGVLADYMAGFSVALIMAGSLVAIGGILVATDNIFAARCR